MKRSKEELERLARDVIALNTPDTPRANSHCAAPHGSEWFNKLPKQLPQRQDSLLDQLHDLQRVATRLGMYDAADYINSIQNK